MQKRDGRSISDATLEVLRERAVAMLEAGNSPPAYGSSRHRFAGRNCKEVKDGRG
jgi:hypothetical protein